MKLHLSDIALLRAAASLAAHAPARMAAAHLGSKLGDLADRLAADVEEGPQVPDVAWPRAA